MASCGLPVLYVLFVWWFLTGVIVYLDGLPRRTFVWSLTGASFVMAAGLYGLAASRNDETVSGAYCAFTSALLVWGWHEMSFLMGLVTGPRNIALPQGCSGWRRLGFAMQTILYHEIALALTAMLIIALTLDGSNHFGLWTFMILWFMRISAKLNVFLGVPNLAQEFLPDHLKFLETYFRKRPMNWLFPVSITLSAWASLTLTQRIFVESATEYSIVGFTFLATLMALAMLEHWFLVLPFEATQLWSWGLKSHVAGEIGEKKMIAATVARRPESGHGKRVLLPR